MKKYFMCLLLMGGRSVMIMKHAFMYVLFFISVAGFSQSSLDGGKVLCDCRSNFEWMKKTFEENDAGFQYAIDMKGKDVYEKHNDLFLKKVMVARDVAECRQVLYDWLTFFRKGHISVRVLTSKVGSPKSQWESYNIDLKEFEKYLATKREPDFEGIWESGGYRIAIKQIDKGYVGVIVSSLNDEWKQGEVKLKVDQNNVATYYRGDRSRVKDLSVEKLGNSVVKLGNSIFLRRISPSYTLEKVTEDYFKLVTAQRPYIEELSKTTLLLRIPSFEAFFKKDIDSLLVSNRDKLLKTKNLIIDVRNNPGGFDTGYHALLPLLYTNPIRRIGTLYLSTELNNRRMIAFANSTNYGFSEGDKKLFKEYYDTLERHRGKFVNLDDRTFTIYNFSEVVEYPANIAVVIDGFDGSTTEQFLLAARQSRKVKLFGTNTAGILDISDMYYVKSPCEEFELGYCISKSLRIPDMSIDGKGIQPDFYIDKSIPPQQWIDFVKGVLEGK